MTTATKEIPLYVNGAEDPTVPDFTMRCRACGQVVKHRGFAGHAAKHVRQQTVVIDGATYRVHEVIAYPRSHFYLRPEPAR